MDLLNFFYLRGKEILETVSIMFFLKHYCKKNLMQLQKKNSVKFIIT